MKPPSRALPSGELVLQTGRDFSCRNYCYNGEGEQDDEKAVRMLKDMELMMILDDDSNLAVVVLEGPT